jgi:hypothetical protein
MAEFITINPTAAQRLAVTSSIPYTARITERVAMHARLLAPGSMKQKIRAVSLPGPSPIGLVISDHPATTYVLHGTKAHKIYPKKPGGVLVFNQRGGGSKIFARVVNHPGTKANNFLMKALRSV